jgi:site-specific recombinase XerD
MTIPQALDQLSDAMRVRHLSHRTEQSYRLWLQSYMKSLPSRPPAWSSEQKVEAFLTGLARRGVSASTQNQALNAVVFFYCFGN